MSVNAADGGIRSLRDLRYADALVRKYSNPSGTLYAYREDGQHVVVSRGDEPGDVWETRVPAERERLLPGQMLWTMPDNWRKRAVVSRDTIAYGLFENPETGLWAKVSIPTNDHVCDAWYRVRAVGDLDVELVDDIGGRLEARAAANATEEHSEELADAMHAVASNWSVVEEGYREDVAMFRDERLEGDVLMDDHPARLRDDWTFEATQHKIARPDLVIDHAPDIDLPDGVDAGDVVRAFRRAGVLPGWVTVEIVIDESVVGMEHHVRALVEAGCTPAEAIDYYMTELKGLTQTAWGDERGGRDPSTISENVEKAEEKVEV